MSAFIGVIIFVLLIIMVIAMARIFMMVWRDNMLFAPIKQKVYTPDGNVVDFMLQTENGPIHAQYHVNRVGAPPVVFFHGTNANISCRKYVVEMARTIDANLLLVDYPGYGEAPGFPSIGAIAGSGIAAVNWLVKKGYHRKEIRLWAESIGSVAGASIVKQLRCHSLVVLFGVPSFKQIMAGFDSPAVRLLGKLSEPLFPSETNAACYQKTRTKIILLHSKTDELIPFSAVEEMSKSIPEKYFGGLVVIGGGHSTPIITPEQMEHVFAFAELKIIDKPALCVWAKGMSTIARDLNFRIDDKDLWLGNKTWSF